MAELLVPGVRTGPSVVGGPQIQRQDVSSGTMALADAQNEIDARKRALQLNDLRLRATTQLSEAQLEAEKQPWNERQKWFQDKAAEINANLSKGFGTFDGQLKSAFAADWGKLYGSANIDVMTSARKGEIDHHTAVLDDTLTTLSAQAAQAGDPRQSALLVEQAGKAVATAQRGGILTESQAGDMIRGFSRGVDKNRARILIDKNPNEGLKQLQGGGFQNLKEEDRIMLVEHANAKIQHQAAMADHAAIVAERQRKLVGDQVAKEGADLVAKGQMTEDWMNANRRVLDTSDYRMLRQAMAQGGGTDSARTTADLMDRLYVKGEDIGPDAVAAFRRGEMSFESARSFLNENKSTQGVESPVMQGRKYITQSLKVSEIAPDPAQAQRLANAMAAFNQQMREDPKQDPNVLSRSIVKQYSFLNFDQFSTVWPLPKFAVGDEKRMRIGGMDTRATLAATKKAFIAKHGGDATAAYADPDARREMMLIKQWEQEQKKFNTSQDVKQ